MSVWGTSVQKNVNRTTKKEEENNNVPDLRVMQSRKDKQKHRLCEKCKQDVINFRSGFSLTAE